MKNNSLTASQSAISSIIWSMANMLRGPYRPPQYRRVMLPLVVLARFDAILAPYTDAMKQEADRLHAMGDKKPIERIYDMQITSVMPAQNRKQPLYNISGFNLKRLLEDSDHIAQNFISYLQGFSANARNIFDKFEFEKEIEKLDSSNRLYSVLAQFQTDLIKNGIDLSPSSISNLQMGYLFEELVRKFNEQANEEAGDHFTPREVIHLMVNLIFAEDGKTLSTPHIIKSLYDPTAGTGGMLSEAEKHLKNYNDSINLSLYGQEYNPESYAICCSDLLIKDESVDHIIFGDTLGVKEHKDKGNGYIPYDGHMDKKFDYMFSNPPFGVEWKTQKDFIEDEAKQANSRFIAGLPRINDGALLFLQHMISKMKPVEQGGSRIAVVFNGSPLFTGDAGSGESNIRRWIIENDWLEAIVALPDQLFYNTGIYTYIWLVSNKKRPERKGKIQLIDGTAHYQKMVKSLGSKRHYLTDEQIQDLTSLYHHFEQNSLSTHTAQIASKIFNNQDFGYIKLTVERPLRLNFEVSPERLARLEAALSLFDTKKIDEAEKQLLIKTLQTLAGTLYKNRNTFSKMIDQALKKAELKIKNPVKKLILDKLSEQDPTADPCTDSKGNPEADPQLRDSEQVPLSQNIALPLPLGFDNQTGLDALLEQIKPHCEAYMQSEVLPHVPDAWVDYSKTKIGYEIPLNRHFYRYQAPRDLGEIKNEISELEQEILQMLGEL